MIKKFHSNQARLRRHQRMRRHLVGNTDRPRLSVFRSGRHIYAQLIDDTTGQTIVAASTLDEKLRSFVPSQETVSKQAETIEVEQAPAPVAETKAGKGKRTAQPAAEKKVKKTPAEKLAAIADNRKVALAREVGKLLAQRAKEKGVTQVVFDRGGYTYHGRVAAVAEGAREIGLDF